MVRWEYARFEYRAAGVLGNDRHMDWDASFHTAAGVQRWGTDEKYDDIPHLNRAGAAGWEVYHRAAVMSGHGHELYKVTYSLKRQQPPRPTSQGAPSGAFPKTRPE